MIHNKQKIIVLLTLCFMIFIEHEVRGQATNSNFINNNYSNNKYLGWNNSNGINPLLFKTNATNRMKLNGNTNYGIDGYFAPRNGYLLLGISNNSISPGWQNIYTQKGAFSLLHINGPGSAYQEYGYRPWMKTGVTFTGNEDLSYFGLRKVGSGGDITETTITWSDNSNSSQWGPDDMTFRFTGSGSGSNTISSNLNTINDLDGLHIARFTPSGEFGLGNTFGVNATGTPANLYVRPQSLMHMSLDKSLYGFKLLTKMVQDKPPMMACVWVFEQEIMLRAICGGKKTHRLLCKPIGTTPQEV